MSDALPHTSEQYIRYGYTKEWYNCSKTFIFNTFLAFNKMPIPLAILCFFYKIYDWPILIYRQ